MDVAKVIQQHKRLCLFVSEKKLKQSLDILSNMIANTSSGDLKDDYENVVMTYRNMLTYTIEGIQDPERPKIYLKLVQSILKLSDRARQDILSHYSGWHTYWVKQQADKEMKLSGQTLVETVDDLIFKTELDELLKLSHEIIPNPENQISIKHKHLIKNIFNHLWLTDYYGEAENSLIGIILKSGKFRWYESSIFATAITLSSLRTWQSEKLLHLIKFYEAGQEQVMERALSGVVLNLHYHNNRITAYPEILENLKKLSSDKKFKEHCMIVVLQAIRARETEILGKKLQDEILPQVARLKPMIEEKLDLDNILPTEKNEGKNPDWSAVFNDSEEIFKTMEELTKLQMEGADVYMSAFANLKHFDFFKDFQNWFVPFYPDHETVNEIYKDEILGPGTNELAEALYKTPFICNSDKYSLLLNLKYLPSAQKSMMLKVFRMELEGLQQLNDDETIIDPGKGFRTRVTQYLQDFYRFFKLSPYKKEFEDLFIGKLDLYNSEFFKIISKGLDAEAGLADYFFNKNFYDDALDLYQKQLDQRPDDVQLNEKTGYCYQERRDYESALTFYKRAEIIDRKVWTVKKIGLCLRKLGRDEEALEYYLQACSMEPHNIHSVIMTAHCYLNLKDYENALQQYFKVEYNEPENLKVLRPIAYCYFALGRFEESEKYYDRLAEGKLSAKDYINIGHLALCKGNKKEAVDYYRRSIVVGELTKEQFMSTFAEDKEILLSLNVKSEDLPILLDYLLFIIG